MRKPPSETVTLDREALERLETARNGNENLSDVIKRCIRPRRTAEEVLKAFRKASISRATIKAIDESANRRRMIPHRTKS